MGWGDDLIWLGEAKHQYLKDGKPRRPTREWVPQPIKEAYLYSPYVNMRGGYAMEERHLGKRPYQGNIDYVLKPAEITLSKEELDLGDIELAKGSYWIVCPDNKPEQAYGNNKIWGVGFPNWLRLVELIKAKWPNQRILRLRPDYARENMPLVEQLDSPGFRYAASMARQANLIITTEGFWHHLAAAWSVPAVVIYGGSTSPHPSVKRNHSGTGYQGQCNIIDTEEPETPCYNTKPNCPHCKKVWAKITPEVVMSRLEEYVNEKNIIISS
jgi:ADP-heptose:LPS heptosyltransferase